MGIRFLEHKGSFRSLLMNIATFYAREVLCYTNNQPIERAWQKTGLGNSAGPFRRPELYIACFEIHRVAGNTLALRPFG